MQAELEALGKALGNPKRPVVAIVGGAKVSTKLDLLGNLVGKVDELVIGGGMANTFLLRAGHRGRQVAGRARPRPTPRARSCDKAKAPAATCCCRSTPWWRPKFEAGAPHAGGRRRTDAADDEMILDVGPEVDRRIASGMEGCRTLVWNGPLGAFETPPFDAGTVAVARDGGRRSTRAGKLLSVAGGGDTVAALAAAGVADEFTYVSTAGGAFLEWMEGKTLPGVAALIRAA